MKLLIIRYPLPRRPTHEEWRRAWALTGIPQNTRLGKGCWTIKTPEAQRDAVVSFLQDISESLGLVPSLPIDGR